MSSRGFTITKSIRAERRARAEAMQAEYNKLSLEEKIARLPKDGAKKQRARLLKQLAVRDKKNVTPENTPEVLYDVPTTKVSIKQNKKEDK